MAKENGMELLDYLKQIEGSESRKESDSMTLRRLDPEQVLFIP